MPFARTYRRESGGSRNNTRCTLRSRLGLTNAGEFNREMALGYLSLMAVVWVGWMDQLVSTGIDKGAASVSEVTHLRRLPDVLRALDIIITAPPSAVIGD